MRTVIFAFLVLSIAMAPGLARGDSLGLYFSDSEFTFVSAHGSNSPGFTLASFIVLTGASGSTVAGYEVAVGSSAADFSIPLTNLVFDFNAGTNTNQIVTFLAPKPVTAGGTVLATVFLTTDSIDPETISFGPSSPATIAGSPVVKYVAAGDVACGGPFGTPVVAWLNGEGPVGVDGQTWGGLKALFR